MAFTDTFTGTSLTDLPVYSANWLTPSGGTTCEIDNNSMVGSTATAVMHCNYWNATFANAHYSKGIVTVTAGTTGGQHGVAIRIQTGVNSFFYCICADNNDPVKVFPGQCVAGALTDWDAGILGFVNNDEMEFAVDATTPTTIHVKKNGTIVQTYTGKSALTGGKAGVAAYNRQHNVGLLSWEGGDVPTVDTSVRGRRIYVMP